MNNKNVACVFMFAGGCCLGSIATWIFAKKKYEEIIQKEVESARNQYNNMAKELADKNRKEKEMTIPTNKYDEEPVEVVEDSYTEIVNEVINSESAVDDIVTEDEIDSMDEIQLEEVVKPYLIQEEEYGTKVGYDYQSLTYYQRSGVVVDEDGEEQDYVHMIGNDTLDKFGYIQKDPYVIYVRNDTYECDYEVLLSDSDYEE